MVDLLDICILLIIFYLVFETEFVKFTLSNIYRYYVFTYRLSPGLPFLSLIEEQIFALQQFLDCRLQTFYNLQKLNLKKIACRQRSHNFSFKFMFLHIFRESTTSLPNHFKLLHMDCNLKSRNQGKAAY